MIKQNRFYTILIVPEKTEKIKKWIIPLWLLRLSSVVLAFLVLITGVMFFDYWYVMSQIGENRQLKIENRRMRSQLQIFQNKISTIESTMERVQTFATQLKVIMYAEDKPPLDQKMLQEANIERVENPPSPHPLSSQINPLSSDPENLELIKESQALDSRITGLTQEAFKTEGILQDQYEILFDKKAFLAALPTRQPAPGYFSSGFGVRHSPYGDRIKMHEGLDIANQLGTLIRAPADGEIIFSDSKGGYGKTMIINHGYGIETWYGHLRKFLLTKGTKVKRGTQIALLGNSGRSTGPHVHYEVRVHGYPVDPRSYIFETPNP